MPSISGWTSPLLSFRLHNQVTSCSCPSGIPPKVHRVNPLRPQQTYLAREGGNSLFPFFDCRLPPSLRTEEGARRDSTTGRFITTWLSDEVKTAIISVEHSIVRLCAVLNCAVQLLCEKILLVQDRASCLPESSGRALVADAREIRQYQTHSLLTPAKRDGHRVRHASHLFNRLPDSMTAWFLLPSRLGSCRHRRRPASVSRLWREHGPGILHTCPQICTTARSEFD
jgi:hypothetical protein